MSLLSEIERDRLRRRPPDAKTRASNDVRIRKKLRSWIHDLDDIALICEYLPEDQLAKEMADNDVYFLMSIAKSFMKTLKFMPIVGKVDQPEGWKIKSNSGIEYPVSDMDIDRSLTIKKIIDDIMPYHGWYNPIDSVLELSRMESIPELKNKITEGDRKGLERVREALMNYDRPIHKKVETPKKVYKEEPK